MAVSLQIAVSPVAQVFIDSKYKLAYNGRYTTDEEITGMLIAVLFAGQHTSSVTCTWTLLSMLANQVQHNVYSEHTDAAMFSARLCLYT